AGSHTWYQGSWKNTRLLPKPSRAASASVSLVLGPSTMTTARSFSATAVSAAATGLARYWPGLAGSSGRWWVKPGAISSRGLAPTREAAASSASTPRYLPVAVSTPPTTLLMVAASSTPSSTRTTTTNAPVTDRMSASASGSVPSVPSAAAWARLPNTSTGSFSGKASASACGAVPTTPITEVAASRIG